MDFSIHSQPYLPKASTPIPAKPASASKANDTDGDMDPTTIVARFARMLVDELAKQDNDHGSDPSPYSAP